LREFDSNGGKPDPVSVIFGIVQTAFYIDFAWVYYSRQRVKLRHGGLVDSDDLRSGWLLSRVLGNKYVAPIDGEDDGDEEAPALGGAPRTGSKWGSRGISVSADDGVLENEAVREEAFSEQEDGFIDNETAGDEDAKMRDPDELAKILDDNESGDEGVLPSSSKHGIPKNGSEWDA
jgi:hypothetical protein